MKKFDVVLVHYEKNGVEEKCRTVLKGNLSRGQAFEFFDKYLKSGTYTDQFGQRLAFKQIAVNMWQSYTGLEQLWFKVRS